MSGNNYVVGAYVGYLVLSIGLTVWVARTLSKNGRVFLVDSFLGNTELADSVNRLLVVGFYLINVGYVTLALKYGDKPTDLSTTIETLSTKVGLVLAGARGDALLQPLHLLEDAEAWAAAVAEAAGAARFLSRAGPCVSGAAHWMRNDRTTAGAPIAPALVRES